ncbi:MAG: Ig-like domain-containing protein, partial [Duncaniella sp.]|nr:Ig-like domain-containing protein [Duncaniella sp.]
EGQTLTLTATIDPEMATDKTVIWSTSDEEVATVEEGVVTAVKAGQAVITAKTTNGLSANCNVTVTAQVIEPTGISLDKTEASIVEGQTLTLTATIDPELATDKTVIWSTSDEEVATVEDGVVTAVKAGQAVITAKTTNGLSATCNVTVTTQVIQADGITLDVTETDLMEGETLKLTATISPAETTDKSVTWTSSNVEVATVSDGVVTALKPGEVIITASTVNGLTASCHITVIEKEPEVILVSEIIITPESVEALPGTEVQLEATVFPAEATNPSLEWSTSDAKVATVDESGLVKIISEGRAVITAIATDGSGVTAQCIVDGLTGIEVLLMQEGNADIFDMRGILIKKNADRSEISSLPNGVYILRIQGKTYKILKR